LKRGADQLREYRLTPESVTRRVVATCCNTPIFLEFAKGYWRGIYGRLWPTETRPVIQMRTMTGYALRGASLSGDVPNPKTQNLTFMTRLRTAWIRIGFKVPKIAFAKGVIDA
jgi:hypothetical protein